ncbi:unnamed protein product, partial [marine sediment metagenome]
IVNEYDYDLLCPNCGTKFKFGTVKHVQKEFNPYGENNEELATLIKKQIASNKQMKSLAGKNEKINGSVHLYCPIEDMVEARKWMKDHDIN